MAYQVLKDFKDLGGDGHEYKTGDAYPHTGEADAKRVEILIRPTEQRGSLIAEILDTKAKAKVEEKPKTTKKKSTKKEEE